MRRVRVIPVLTVANQKLVKTVKFKNPNYIGDPINAVKIFNEKEVDEIVLLDITATKENRPPNFELIEEICSEAFMPFAYGGGIKTIQQIEILFKLGIEKVILNSTIENNFKIITEASKIYGSQSIVASIDVKKNIFGKYNAFKISGSKKIKKSLIEYLKQLEEFGAGEIFINIIDRDGTYSDYDFELIENLAKEVNIPIVICGGAINAQSFLKAIQKGASAVAAGSLFVYTGNAKGILINYPSQENLINTIFNKL